MISYMGGSNQVQGLHTKKSVVTSSTIVQSVLSKRHNILSYHRVRKAIAAKITAFHWCDSSQYKK